MTLRHLSLPFFLLFLFWFFLLSHYPPSPRYDTSNYQTQVLGESWELNLVGRDALESAALRVRVRARVGVKKISIQGYTSPYAQVTLSGEGLYQKTTAQRNGIFIFDQIYLPQVPTELCFTAQDSRGALSSFLCLPKFVPKDDLSIKDVYLPPTLTLEEGQIDPQKTLASRGFTTPNSKVSVYFFEKGAGFFWGSSWVKKVWAKTPPRSAGPPRLETKSNELGFFEFNLPSHRPGSFRLFASSTFTQEDFQLFSPKSNTLVFKVLGLWERVWVKFWAFLLFLFALLKTLLGNPWAIIMGEAAILAFLIYRLRGSTSSRTLIQS